MASNKPFLILTGASLVLLGGSIALNMLLFDRAKQYYLEVNATRLDPVGLGYYPSNPIPTPDSQTIQVVFFGDSRAASWIAPTVDGYEFINRGIGSQTSVQIIQRFAAHVRPLQPDVVVIQVGINDLKTIALFPDRQDSILANCRTNIRRMVEEARDLGAVVILTTIFPTGTVPLERRPFWSGAIEQAVQDMNAYIATLAGDRVLVFDTFALLADQEGRMTQSYESDELHLNPQGYAVINQALVPLLDRIVQSSILREDLPPRGNQHDTVN